jgi:tRNA threonylcarbamoyladenosine biosynthesis protein TsaB
VVAERSVRATEGHGRALGPLVAQVLADAGWRPADLGAVAVSIGPGSFTGLRTGLGLAKGIVYALGCALVPVPTLDALAAVAAADPGERVCAILDARKGEVYAAVYRALAAGSLRAETGPMLVRPAELLRRLDGRCRFLGDAVERYGGEIAGTLGAHALLLPFSRYHPRGGVVAELGAKLAPLAGPAAVAALEPSYVRPAYVQVHRPAERSSNEGRPGAEAPEK